MTEPALRGALSDSHLHLADLRPHQPDCLDRILARSHRVVSSCHTRQEVAQLEQCVPENPRLAGLVGISFGIHPQNPVADEWDYLENLAVQNAGKPETPDLLRPRLVAIGECGFDFYESRHPDGPHGEKIQEELFVRQLELAIRCQLPLVLHLRRATDLAFRHARRLKKLPAVIFHAWPAPPEEAFSLLRQGLPAWFSLGTPLIQGNKKACRSLVELPLRHLLLETDAPWQTLKGQTYTAIESLDDIYRQAARLKNSDPGQLAGIINENFQKAYGFW